MTYFCFRRPVYKVLLLLGSILFCLCLLMITIMFTAFLFFIFSFVFARLYYKVMLLSPFMFNPCLCVTVSKFPKITKIDLWYLRLSRNWPNFWNAKVRIYKLNCLRLNSQTTPSTVLSAFAESNSNVDSQPQLTTSHSSSKS